MQQLQKEACECQNEMSSSPSSAGSAPSGTSTLHTTILHKYLEQPGVPLFPRFGFIP